MTLDQMTNREFAYFSVRGGGSCDVITKAIGCDPSQAYSEGDPDLKTGKPRGFTHWRLNSGLDDTEVLERHIDAIILWLNRFPGAVKRLSEEYELTLQCVGWYPGPGHGAHLNREQIRVLGQLGIAVDFDFYFLDDNGHATEM